MFMIQWWESLSLIQQIFGLIAIPSTVILIIQTILVLVGVGEVEGDVDVDFDTDAADGSDVAESANGFALISVRGIIAFLTVGGWTGIVIDSFGAHIAITLMVSLLAGFLALVAVAWLMHLTSKLQDKGNIALKNAVGKTAKVYIAIPETGKSGKVTLTLQGRFTECDAVTQSGKSLTPGQIVVVTGLVDANTLIVKEAKIKA
jgi:membrane protein implicated in regulation of membrane protease activity